MSAFNPNCTACPRLARFLASARQDYPDYHARPVEPFGDRRARFIIVGLAPGMHGANRTGRPFTGDHAGILLYRTLHKHGFATKHESISVDDGLVLKNCRITNAVKCVPPQNKPLPDEIKRCNSYLQVEMDALPKNAVLLALGRVAHTAILQTFKLRQSAYPFAHGAEYTLPRDVRLIDSYHCSRYNTQTRRLTEAMFDSIIAKAAKLLG